MFDRVPNSYLPIGFTRLTWAELFSLFEDKFAALAYVKDSFSLLNSHQQLTPISKNLTATKPNVSFAIHFSPWVWTFDRVRHILCATVLWRVLLSGFEGPWFRARSWPELGKGGGEIVIGEGSWTDKNIPVEF